MQVLLIYMQRMMRGKRTNANVINPRDPEETRQDQQINNNRCSSQNIRLWWKQTTAHFKIQTDVPGTKKVFGWKVTVLNRTSIISTHPGSCWGGTRLPLHRSSSLMDPWLPFLHRPDGMDNLSKFWIYHWVSARGPSKGDAKKGSNAEPSTSSTGSWYPKSSWSHGHKWGLLCGSIGAAWVIWQLQPSVSGWTRGNTRLFCEVKKLHISVGQTLKVIRASCRVATPDWNTRRPEKQTNELKKL